VCVVGVLLEREPAELVNMLGAPAILRACAAEALSDPRVSALPAQPAPCGVAPSPAPGGWGTPCTVGRGAGLVVPPAVSAQLWPGDGSGAPCVPPLLATVQPTFSHHDATPLPFPLSVAAPLSAALPALAVLAVPAGLPPPPPRPTGVCLTPPMAGRSCPPGAGMHIQSSSVSGSGGQALPVLALSSTPPSVAAFATSVPLPPTPSPSFGVALPQPAVGRSSLPCPGMHIHSSSVAELGGPVLLDPTAVDCPLPTPVPPSPAAAGVDLSSPPPPRPSPSPMPSLLRSSVGVGSRGFAAPPPAAPSPPPPPTPSPPAAPRGVEEDL
jgi:hypothetical protein